MDNLTHSLAGVLIAESAWNLRKEEDDPRFRKTLWISSIVANNFPDLDVFFSGFSGGNVSFLLHHRGYTHTLLGGLGEFLVIFLGALLLTRKQNYNFAQKKLLAFVCFLGIPTHIFLDYLNSYGVHPFWPWNNHWFYGDTLIIIEPWVWLTLLPLILFSNFSRRTRWIGIGLCTFAFVLIWGFGFIPWAVASLLTFYFGMLGAFFSIATDRVRLATTWTMLGVILVAFSWTSQQTVTLVSELILKEEPTHKIEDIIRNPLPGNPACWNYISVETKDGLYYSHRGFISVLPKVISSEDCARPLAVKNFFSSDPFSPEKIGDLATVAKNCVASAFLQFSRAPALIRSGQEINLGDLRFMGRARAGFRQFNLTDQCPKYVPPWVPPRENWFR